MKRFLYIWLPQLPLDRRVRLDDPRLGGPFATVREARGAWRVVNANTLAREGGVCVGAGLADARALCPDLLSEPCNPVAEDLLLRALRRWSDRVSPTVALDSPEGLRIDISGVAHLSGGEAPLLARLQAELADLRITAVLAVADTPAAAKAWAKFGPHGSGAARIVEHGGTRLACEGLPVEALESDASHDLRRAGLRTIGQLYGFGATELTRRFGLDLCTRLDRMLGRAPDPLSATQLSRPFATRMTLPEPLMQHEALQGIIARLCAAVIARLEQHGVGAREFVLSVTGPDGDVHHRATGFARPTREVAAVQRGFARVIETLDLPFGAERFRLEARAVQPLVPRQSGLDSHGDVQDALDHLFSLLGNRIGFDRLRRPAPCASHLPERECQSVGVVQAESVSAWPSNRPHRPLRLFAPERVRELDPGDPPRRFEWRRQVYERIGVSGPERVSPEWWSDTPGQLTDYWAVDTQQGPRLWLCSKPGRAAARDWAVSGVFA